jgi:Zn-dependent protease
VPLFKVFGIRVRLHAFMLLFMVLTILVGGFPRFWFMDRVVAMTALFGIVLLHEFGHCFAARAVGGSAEEIVLTPLGGLAYAYAPHAPWPTAVTVAGGPLVNVIICILCGGYLFWEGAVHAPINPLELLPKVYMTGVTRWVYWTYATSYALLMFNMLPIFPLDGGQFMQSLLWVRMGYHRSMLFACNVGLVGSGVLGVLGLVSGGLMLVLLAVSCALACFQMKRVLQEMGPSGLTEYEDHAVSANAFRPVEAPRRRKLSKRSIKRAQKRAAEEQAEQARIDAILDKVSAHGMQSLTWWEKRTLRKATERQRQRDLELSRMRD